MKKPFITTVIVLLLIGLTAAWWAFAAALTELLGDAGRLLAEAVIVSAVAILLIEVLLRLVDLRQRMVHDERQLQALLGLYTSLKPDAPIPILRTAALGTDTALEYVRLIRQLEPSLVLELGSGVSTVLSALQVRRNGTGRVIALDDDETWTRKTRDELMEHRVHDVAEVRYAPLVPYEVDGETVDWYDGGTLNDVARIDLLLIDGPRDLHDRGNRRPGLSYLQPRFSEDIVIVVDDGNRSHWRNWVQQWALEHDFVVETPYLNEKRSMILYRKDSRLSALREGRVPGAVFSFTDE